MGTDKKMTHPFDPCNPRFNSKAVVETTMNAAHSQKGTVHAL